MARIAGEPASSSVPAAPAAPVWAKGLIGQAVGQDVRYELVRVLGVGAMGTVFEGVGNGQRVAVKLLSPATGDLAKRRRARFYRELSAMIRIESSHVVKIFDWGTEPLEYLVMEYLEGEDLGARLSREKKLPWSQARDLAIGICRGLAAAHARGVAHRDLKPSNCFITVDGTVKLLDFGLAWVEGSDKVTRSHEALGTLLYMAPERFSSRSPDESDTALELTDQRSNRAKLGDLYSLGVVLYEMVTGVLPFEAPELSSLLVRLHNQPLRPPSSRGATLSPSAEQLIESLLAKDPRARAPSAVSVLEALEGVAIARRPLRWPWFWGLGIAALLLGLGLARQALHGRPPVALGVLTPTVTAPTLPPPHWLPRALEPAEPSLPPKAERSVPPRRPSPKPTPVAAPQSVESNTAEPEPHKAPPPIESFQDMLQRYVQRCFAGKGLRIKVTLRVDPAGRVSWAKAAWPFGDTEAGRCVERAIRRKNVGARFAGDHTEELKL